MGAWLRGLVVWQCAIELSSATYRLTAGLPEAERFGLANQLRWASVSVARNIAEGYGRSTKGEYCQFFGHARGSVFELQTPSEEVSKMLIAMMKKLQT